MDWQNAPAGVPLNEFVRSDLVLPRHANHYGTLFGPEGLSWLGQVAYLAASRYCHEDIVMAAAKDVAFLAPVPVGSVLHLHARIARVGRSSMTVEVRARVDGATTDALRASFEMVAVDKQGRPVRIQPRDASAAPASAG